MEKINEQQREYIKAIKGDIESLKESYKIAHEYNEVADKEIERLKTQLQQKENIIKEVREYIENNSLYEQDYDYDYEENLIEYPPSDEQARKDILEILGKAEE